MDEGSRAALFAELDFERLAGRPGETRVAETLLRRLRDMGLEPGLEAFPVNTFQTGTARYADAAQGI